VVLYRVEDGIASIVLNRPESLNALSRGMLHELGDVLRAYDADPGARVAILSGAGDRAFSAGVDLKERAVRGERPSSLRLPALAELRKPIIAAIRGYCLGGGLELALNCDIRVAARDARLGQPEIRRGGFPAGGGIARLVRLVGPGTALTLLLTGDTITGAEAGELRIVERVVDPADVQVAARDLAARIARNATEAVVAARELAYRAQEMPFTEWWPLNRTTRTELAQRVRMEYSVRPAGAEPGGDPAS
jgi:enoyl-CoA hydratase